jgi:hypothetical protein
LAPYWTGGDSCKASALLICPSVREKPPKCKL